MAVDNRGYNNDNDRAVPSTQYDGTFEDYEDDEPEFSTYFTDQKVEIPTFPDDDKVSGSTKWSYKCIES